MGFSKNMQKRPKIRESFSNSHWAQKCIICPIYGEFQKLSFRPYWALGLAQILQQPQVVSLPSSTVAGGFQLVVAMAIAAWLGSRSSVVWCSRLSRPGAMALTNSCLKLASLKAKTHKSQGRDPGKVSGRDPRGLRAETGDTVSQGRDQCLIVNVETPLFVVFC